MLQFCSSPFLKSLSNYKGGGLRKVVPKVSGTKKTPINFSQSTRNTITGSEPISGPFPIHIEKSTKAKSNILRPTERNKSTIIDILDDVKIHIEPDRIRRATNMKKRMRVSKNTKRLKPGHVSLIDSMIHSTGKDQRYIISRSMWYARKRALEHRKQSMITTGVETPSEYLYLVESPRIMLMVDMLTPQGLKSVPISNITKSVPGTKLIPEIGPPLGENGSCMTYNYMGSKKIQPLTVFIRTLEESSESIVTESPNPTGFKMFKVHYSLGKLLRHKYLCNTPYWDSRWHPNIFVGFDKLKSNIKKEYNNTENVLNQQIVQLNHLLLFGTTPSIDWNDISLSKSLVGHLCCLFLGNLKFPGNSKKKIAHKARKRLRIMGLQ